MIYLYSGTPGSGKSLHCARTITNIRRGEDKMICVMCGRDINAIGQDNVSWYPGYPICEDCIDADDFKERFYELLDNEE